MHFHIAEIQTCVFGARYQEGKILMASGRLKTRFSEENSNFGNITRTLNDNGYMSDIVELNGRELTIVSRSEIINRNIKPLSSFCPLYVTFHCDYHI